MRIAVIGCGSIGTRHAGNLKALGHQNSLYDVDDWACLTSEAPGLDGAMICTPASTHATVARDLLESGYAGPLFIEKPLACSVEECAIFRSWPHPTVQVGYNWRHNREFAAFRAVSPTDAFHFVCTTPMHEWPGRGYATPLLECSHELDLALSWDPNLQLLEAETVGPTSAWLTLESEHTKVLIDLYWHSPADRWVTALRQNGTAALCHPSPASLIQSYFDELRAWFWCIEHRQAPVAYRSPVDDAIAVLAMVEQIQRRLARPVARPRAAGGVWKSRL